MLEEKTSLLEKLEKVRPQSMKLMPETTDTEKQVSHKQIIVSTNTFTKILVSHMTCCFHSRVYISYSFTRIEYASHSSRRLEETKRVQVCSDDLCGKILPGSTE